MALDPVTGLETVEDALQASPTAYNNAADATPADIAADRRRRALEKTISSAGNKRLQERWYGDSKETKPEETSTPILEKAINALQAPAKAIVGAAQYTRDAVKGVPHDSLATTINKNMASDGETWGGFLRSVSVPGVVAAPLGFVMDLALDPLNWMMMGTSAFVPKVGYGLKQAGLKGAGLAVKEEAKRSSYNVLKHLSGLSLLDEEGKAAVAAGAWAKSLPKGAVMREAFEKSAPLSMRARAAIQKMGDDALEAGAKFDEVTGRNLSSILAKEASAGPVGLAKRPSAQVETFLREKGLGSMVDAWKYSPQEWAMKMKAMDYQDILDGLKGNTIEIRTVDDFLRAEAELDRIAGLPLTTAVPDKVSDAVHALDHVPDEAKAVVAKMSSLAEDGANILQDMPYIRPESLARMNEFIAKSGMDRESVQLIRETLNAMREMGKNKTGWKYFDDMYAKAENLFKTKYSNVPIGKRVLDFVDLTHRIFALMKVPLSPSAWSNAIGGNLVMAHLSGINVLDPKFYSSMKGAYDMSRGRVNEKFFAKMRPYMASIDETTSIMPKYAHKTLGYDPRYMEVMSRNLAADEAVKMAAKDGVVLTHEEVIQALVDASKGVSKSDDALQAAKAVEMTANKAEASSQIAKRARAAKQAAPKTASELRQMAMEGKGDFVLADLPANFATEEIMGGSMEPVLAILKEKSATSLVAKYAYAAATKPGSWYGQIDSVYKLGTWHHLITNGITESELRILNRFLPVSEGITGTIKDGATLRYTISPEKALDAVNEMYMQYAAMPTAVNVMRSIPIIGSPFIAFPYAMTTKVAKALAYNPQAFNKLSFLMDEVGGRKTPLEKQALSTKYYQHLNSPGYLRLEFFKDNPLYLNLTNMIPYYALNQLGPTQRSFDSKWANAVAQVVDSSPFFKGPWGQTLIDDLVIPSFLNDGEAPQGYFGQKLWPTDATTGEKIGYAARNAAEAFTPGVAGFAGVLGAKFPALANPAVTEKIPNAKLRAMLYATQGKNSVGVQTRETPWQKVQRTMMGQLGASVTPVQVEFTQK